MTATIFNEDYVDTVERLYRAEERVDLVITSPPYNTNKKQGKTRTLLNTDAKGGQPWVRYDMVMDDMTQEEYCDFICSFMVDMDAVVKENGVVLLNLGYGNENPDGVWRTVSSIIEGTVWTVADCIVWKKRNAMPNNCSPNRLTRICEFVFVLARKEELGTFHMNKEVKSIRKTGQKSYSSIQNYITAANNDGPCPYNKATFSSEFVGKLLKMYAPEGALVYDPFMGSGTTLSACQKMGFDSIGSEVSGLQCSWAFEHIEGSNVFNGDDGGEEDGR